MNQNQDIKEKKESWRYPPEFPVISGVIHRPYVTPEFLASISQLPVKKGDVFVATYPKAGTTWVSEILWQIYTDGKVCTTPTEERVIFLEEFKLLNKRSGDNPDSKYKGTITECYAKQPHPRLFKTHLRYCYVPKGEGDAPMPKYIYVIRNPKDCAVSYYHHLRRFRFYRFDGDWDEYFELLMQGEVESGYWMDHVLSWWSQKGNSNILFLKYEDMRKDHESAVRVIAQFVGKYVSEDLIKRITSQTSFASMKNGEQYGHGKGSKIIVEGESDFIRKGIVGDWRNYFTEEQNNRFEELYAKRLAGSGLEIEH